jgi:molecular chaperone Hsp33
MNRILRATSKNNEVRAFVAETKDLVNTAVKIHRTTPVASAALGRLLTAGAIMGIGLKGTKDLITISIKGDGPLGGVLVTTDSNGYVKGYVNNPEVDIPLKENGKLDVSSAIGKGTLTVIRDFGLKEPYIGQVELVSGEIADDLTYYYASSEQVPSVIALGVLVDIDLTIKESGGFMIQLLPGATEETIQTIEKNIYEIPSVTTMFTEGLKAEDILGRILNGLEPKVHEIIQPEYKCNCNRKKVEKAIIGIGKKDIQEMIDDGKTIETNCHFCDKTYNFTIDELKVILEKADK